MDWHGKRKIFKKRDHVLIYKSKLGKHLEKLKLRWIGPCIITGEIALGTFSLQNIDGMEYPSHVNGDRLKPYFGLVHGQIKEVRESSKNLEDSEEA